MSADADAHREVPPFDFNNVGACTGNGRESGKFVNIPGLVDGPSNSWAVLMFSKDWMPFREGSDTREGSDGIRQVQPIHNKR